MKKVFGLFMAAALIVSCSDEGKPSVDISKLTAGKWYYSESKTTIAGRTESETYKHACTTSKDYVEFTSGTVNEVEYGTDCVADTYTQTYTVSGNKVTIDGDEVTVKELTATKLVFETSYTAEGVTMKYEDTFIAN